MERTKGNCKMRYGIEFLYNTGTVSGWCAFLNSYLDFPFHTIDKWNDRTTDNINAAFRYMEAIHRNESCWTGRVGLRTLVGLGTLAVKEYLK